jgi:signal transduction histidine kinase
MADGQGGAQSSQRGAISALGHEMRRPLTVIRGAATLLIESAGTLDAATEVEMLSLIDQSVEDLSDLIEDILLMVHVEAGDVSLFLEPVDVADLVATAVELERRHTGEHPVTVLGATPGVTVEADRERSIRALRALVENAARFSDATSPIEIAVHTDGASFVRFEVLDRGPGIAPALQERAFERYEQLGAVVHGLGIGLYLVRGLAAAMGGEAGMGDRPGGGLSVWFTLRRRV